MKKVIGIVNTVPVQFDENSIGKGVGGSETWAIEIAKAFNKHEDVHVVNFCYCNNWHFTPDGIEYVPMQLFQARCEIQHFDYMIISRRIDDTLDIIKETGCCNNIHIMVHDIFIIEKSLEVNGVWKTIKSDYIHFWKNDKWRMENVKKILVLCDWHKKDMMEKYNFPEKMLYVTANGIDIEMIKKYSDNKKRDNCMLWSSRYERNLDVLVEKIAPLVIKEIPDFKIFCCSYTNDLGKYKNLLEKDYVENLGSLNKEDLYKEMSKHKCLFYPVHFQETFCITVLEQALCGNMLVISDRYGPGTTLSPYNGFFFDESVDFYNDEEACKKAAKMIVDYIKNYKKPHHTALRESMQKYIEKQFNWDKIANDLLEMM